VLPVGRRAKAAQRSAMFDRVISLNGLTIPLDYTTTATDEMTARLNIPCIGNTAMTKEML
jgi:hypothetical protein